MSKVLITLCLVITIWVSWDYSAEAQRSTKVEPISCNKKVCPEGTWRCDVVKFKVEPSKTTGKTTTCYGKNDIILLQTSSKKSKKHKEKPKKKKILNTAKENTKDTAVSNTNAETEIGNIVAEYDNTTIHRLLIQPQQTTQIPSNIFLTNSYVSAVVKQQEFAAKASKAATSLKQAFVKEFVDKYESGQGNDNAVTSRKEYILEMVHEWLHPNGATADQSFSSDSSPKKSFLNSMYTSFKKALQETAKGVINVLLR